MKKVILASVLMFLTACDPFEGVLSVKEGFTVKSKDNDNIVNVAVPVGDVNAKFEFPSKKEIDIKTTINGKKKTLTLILPKKLSIPDNGNFSIAAADLGQDFGADGATQTTITDGGPGSGYQSCTYQRRETRCTTDPKGNTICQDYWVTVNGQQYVEFQIRNTTNSINVSFGRDANVMAVFSGSRSSSERLIRYQGQCY